MSRQKQTAKPEANEKVTENAETEIASGAEDNGETGETIEAVENAKPAPDQATATTPEASAETASGSEESDPEPAAIAEPSSEEQTAASSLRRFVVLKPVRFNGKRIPRTGRVTVTHAGHEALASLGAVSPVWDHGISVKAE